MDDDTYNLIGSKDNHVVMDNRLISSKQMMPLNAAKIVRMAVARIAYEDNSFRTYQCSITELAEFLQVCAHTIGYIGARCRAAQKRTVFDGQGV